MTDGLSTLYQDLLDGSYDCVDRIVLNAYFRMGCGIRSRRSPRRRLKRSTMPLSGRKGWVHTRYVRFRCRAFAPGLRHQHVLYVIDEKEENCKAFNGNEAEYLKRFMLTPEQKILNPDGMW
jgi:hypothetical protein